MCKQLSERQDGRRIACLIEYYKTNEVNDDKTAADFIKNSPVKDILSNAKIWGSDLSIMFDLTKEGIDKIHTVGIREAVKWAMS